MRQMKLFQLQVNMEKQNCCGKSTDLFKNCKMFVNYAKKVKEMLKRCKQLNIHNPEVTIVNVFAS